MKVDWKTIRLSEENEEGYGESAKPIDDIIKAEIKKRVGNGRPALVWIFDGEKDQKNDLLEGKLFGEEKIGLALKRFSCLRGDIMSIPDDRLLKKIARRVPMFYFYDPAGDLLEKLEGKRATSRSGVVGRVEKLWRMSFDLKLKAYVKQMKATGHTAYYYQWFHKHKRTAAAQPAKDPHQK